MAEIDFVVSTANTGLGDDTLIIKLDPIINLKAKVMYGSIESGDTPKPNKNAGINSGLYDFFNISKTINNNDFDFNTSISYVGKDPL